MIEAMQWYLCMYQSMTEDGGGGGRTLGQREKLWPTHSQWLFIEKWGCSVSFLMRKGSQKLKKVVTRWWLDGITLACGRFHCFWPWPKECMEEEEKACFGGVVAVVGGYMGWGSSPEWGSAEN